MLCVLRTMDVKWAQTQAFPCPDDDCPRSVHGSVCVQLGITERNVPRPLTTGSIVGIGCCETSQSPLLPVGLPAHGLPRDRSLPSSAVAVSGHRRWCQTLMSFSWALKTISHSLVQGSGRPAVMNEERKSLTSIQRNLFWKWLPFASWGPQGCGTWRQMECSKVIEIRSPVLTVT